MPEVVVRPGREEDLADLLRIERDLPTAPHWPEAEYRAILDPPPPDADREGSRRCLRVAIVEGRLIGFAVGRVLGALRAPPEMEAELETIAVGQAAQNRGAGRLLLEEILGWAQLEGATTMTLEVRSGSLRAQRLYARCGFAVTGRRPRYYAHPEEDAVLMRWQAPAAPDWGE